MSWGWYPSSKDRKRDRLSVQREAKKIKNASPVVVEGRTIATTFWGKAWCDNLESYSDYENRLPRGRTYCRNGSIADLKIKPGEITASVIGSSLYTVNIEITDMPNKKLEQLVKACSSNISSMVELLEGRLSSSVMETVTDKSIGLFPAPKEISLSCSCPDWATMCKHVAAVMYGVGNRLDRAPELLFTLRGVDAQELLTNPQTIQAPTIPESSRIMASVDLWEVFEIDHSQEKFKKGRAKAKSKPTAKANKRPIGRSSSTKKKSSASATGK
jgi:uncharacterized Zn finger protein